MAVKKIAYRINVAKSNFHHISGAYVGKGSTGKEARDGGGKSVEKAHLDSNEPVAYIK